MEEPDIAPEGTLMLEPREQFDACYMGVVHQGGTVYAVYSRTKVIDAIYTDIAASATESEQDSWTTAVEHYEFNVSGSIGPGYPVFWMDDEEPE